jgi:hypothetical protein
MESRVSFMNCANCGLGIESAWTTEKTANRGIDAIFIFRFGNEMQPYRNYKLTILY